MRYLLLTYLLTFSNLRCQYWKPAFGRDNSTGDIELKPPPFGGGFIFSKSENVKVGSGVIFFVASSKSRKRGHFFCGKLQISKRGHFFCGKGGFYYFVIGEDDDLFFRRGSKIAIFSAAFGGRKILRFWDPQMDDFPCKIEICDPKIPDFSWPPEAAGKFRARRGGFIILWPEKTMTFFLGDFPGSRESREICHFLWTFRNSTSGVIFFPAWLKSRVRGHFFVARSKSRVRGHFFCGEIQISKSGVTLRGGFNSISPV